MQNLINAAEEYLHQHPEWKRIQFDILAISILKNKPVEYFLIEDVPAVCLVAVGHSSSVTREILEENGWV